VNESLDKTTETGAPAVQLTRRSSHRKVLKEGHHLDTLARPFKPYPCKNRLSTLDMEATGSEQNFNLAIVLALVAVLACSTFLQSASWSVLPPASAEDMFLMYDQLRHIPTVGGPSSPLISYLGSIRLYSDASKLLQEGYKTV
jgi:hypothetical protein